MYSYSIINFIACKFTHFSSKEKIFSEKLSDESSLLVVVP